MIGAGRRGDRPIAGDGRGRGDVPRLAGRPHPDHRRRGTGLRLAEAAALAAGPPEPRPVPPAPGTPPSTTSAASEVFTVKRLSDYLIT